MLLVVPFFCRNFNGFFKIVNISSFAIKCYIGQGHIDYLLIDDIKAGLILKDPGEHKHQETKFTMAKLLLQSQYSVNRWQKLRLAWDICPKVFLL